MRNKLIFVPYLVFIGGLPECVTKSPVCEYVDAIYVPREEAKYFLDVQYDEKVKVVSSEILKKLEERLRGKKPEKDGKGAGQGARNRCVVCHSIICLM